MVKQFDAVKRLYETVAKDRCNLGTAMRGFLVLSTLDGASPINIWAGQTKRTTAAGKAKNGFHACMYVYIAVLGYITW